MNLLETARLVIILMVVWCALPVWAQKEAAPQESAPVTAPAAAEQAAEPAPPAEPAPTAPPATELETTIDFSLTGPTALSGVVGEVEIRGIEFVRTGAKPSAIKGAFGASADALRSDLTLRLSCATSAAKKWKLAVTVDLLDDEGAVIDRVSDSFSTKDEAKIFETKHTTLAWVVPHIAKAKLSISARQ